jgi:hypothetical protein
MQPEHFLMLDVQRKSIERMCDDYLSPPEPEEDNSASGQREPIVPLKPRHRPAALLCWWLGCRLVKTGQRFLQYAG